jgi:type IX secretion system PorP/SprF family membrane protein
LKLLSRLLKLISFVLVKARGSIHINQEGMKHKYFLFIFSFVLSLNLWGQDRHFSQFYSAPIYLNPANTGAYEGKFRLGLIYRDQWRGTLDNPFITNSGYVDIRTKLKISSSHQDFAGIGVLFFADKVGSVDFNTNNLSIVGAIHKSLDIINSQYLSFGLQFGLSSRNINYEKLNFADQFNGIDLYSLNSNEVFPENNFSFSDLSTGLQYSVRIRKSYTVYFGGAIHHILTPLVSFYKDDNGAESRLPRKFTVYGGTELPISYAASLVPRIILMSQGSHFEITAGSNIRMLLNDYSSFALHLGAWLRNTRDIDKAISPDAVVLLAGIEYNRILLGFSYDLNLGSLSRFNTGKQAFEISIGYLGEHEEDGIVCPKF